MNNFWRKRIALVTTAVMAVSLFSNVITSGDATNQVQAAGPEFTVCHVNTATGGQQSIEVTQGERFLLQLAQPNSYLGECEIEIDDAVVPQLHCVFPEQNGTYTAYFGYQNDNSTTVTIPHNVITNRLSKGFSIINGAQPTLFNTGVSAGYPNSSFNVNFPSNSQVKWTLIGPDGESNAVTANKNSPICGVCGDGEVNQETEECDYGIENGSACTAAYDRTCTYCSSDCTEEVTVTGPYCGDNKINGDEACDGGENCAENCTLIPAATVIAHKIICNNQTTLPNRNGGADITSTTAATFVANNPGCSLATGWSFQRGNESAGNGGDATYGEVIGNGRTTFSDGDNDGVATVNVPVAGLSKIQMREVNQVGYIPFDSNSNGNGSAEFYCHTDVAGYDNRERINGPQAGTTYYCVGFNAPIIKTPVCGDNFVDINETCDDGNQVNTDACLNTCVVASCGDMVVQDGVEQCDGGDDCTKNCTIQEDTTNVVFHKIVCDAEQYLPNRNGGADITSTTAATFVAASNGHCRFAEGREFEWREKAGSTDAGDELYGPAAGWNTVSATNASGQVSVSLSIEATTDFAFREVNKEGYIPFDHVNGFGAEFYCNTDVANYDNREFIDGAQEDATYYCVAFNAPKPKPSAKVILHKIVCDEEKYLPNRGKNGAPKIKDNTAQNFVDDNSEHCWFENDRTFQYAPVGSNPGDNIGEAGSPRTSLTPTDGSGMTMISLPVDEIDEYAFREISQKGYVSFSYEEDTSNTIDVSAEIYCHKDGANYDNRDFVQGMKKNEEYNCVAFNALKKVPTGDLYITKVECPVTVVTDDMYTQNLVQVVESDNPWGDINREEQGCTLVDGYEFGYQEEGEETIIDLPATVSGILQTTLPVGFYTVGELDGDTWMDEENMVSFACVGNSGPSIEIEGNNVKSVGDIQLLDMEGFNPESIYIHKKETTYCLAVNPKRAECGNGFHEAGEECDDGNEVNNDECSNECTIVNNEPVCEEYETGYATSVTTSSQGLRKNGTAVLPERSITSSVLGAPNGIGSPASGFYSMGFSGTITVTFDTPVFNEAGGDISIHELTNGRETYPLETVTVEVSQDGTTRYSLGTVDSSVAVSYVDLTTAGLNRAQYVRITDTSNSAIHDATADGFDLDAVDAVYLCADDNNGGDGDGNTSSTSSSDGQTTSVNRVVPKKEKDTPNNSSSNNDSNEGNDEPTLPGLLETGGGEEEEQPAEDTTNPEALVLGPGAGTVLPAQLGATGASPWEIAMKVLAALKNLIN